MRVVRTQWPVGQGCFATGIVDAKGSKPLQYVYDCGARNVSDLAPIVSAYADRTESIEALFVSHLDGDHVDGLDCLLATVKATAVYLPYLTMTQRVAAVLEADAAGRLSGSLIQAQLDPVNWFGSRGVERVVLVRNSGDAAEGGFVLREEGGGPRPESGKVFHFKTVGPIQDGPAEYGTKSDSGAELLHMAVGGAVLAMLGSAPKWLLVPYVPYVDPANFAAFRESVLKVLGLKDTEHITAEAVTQKLRDKSGRSELRDCYDEILNNGGGSNHNKISMSLYSGPSSCDSHWKAHRCHMNWCDWPFGHYYERCSHAGWIGTGDAKLRNRRRRRAWEHFYCSLLPKVGTMLLPHHGSKENWHSDLLNSIVADLFVAAADEQDKGYKHPSQSVVADIHGADKWLAHVTRQPNSRLVEIVDDTTA